MNTNEHQIAEYQNIKIKTLGLDSVLSKCNLQPIATKGRELKKSSMCHQRGL